MQITLYLKHKRSIARSLTSVGLKYRNANLKNDKPLNDNKWIALKIRVYYIICISSSNNMYFSFQEPIEDGDTETFPIEYGALVGEDPLVTSEEQIPRRVITDTGDIVEEPLIYKPDHMVQQEPIAIGIAYIYTVIIYLG